MGLYKECAPNGGYTPSFYYIEIDTDVNCSKLNDDQFFQTVAHEYIHFLQDFFTTYGMTRTITTYNLISYLYNSNADVISLPLKIDRFFSHNHCAYINDKLFACYENPIGYNLYGYKINRNEFDEVKLKTTIYSIENMNVQMYRVCLFKRGKMVYEFPFGAQAIVECMAHLFEDLLYPDNSMSYSIPYDIPCIIMESILGSVSSKMLFLICSASLMGYNAAEMFMMILRKITQREPITSVTDIDSIIRSHNSPNKTFRSLYYETKSQLIVATRNLFNIDNDSFNDARDWAIEWLDENGSFEFLDFLISLFDYPLSIQKEI